MARSAAQRLPAIRASRTHLALRQLRVRLGTRPPFAISAITVLSPDIQVSSQNARDGYAHALSSSGGALLDRDLVIYLDGKHHADEIQVRFGLSWKRLESALGLDEVVGGKGKKGVALLYR